MKVAVISDIHANLDALRRVAADARKCGAERFVSLGDIVGYGPLPKEALDEARRICSISIAGNHDDAVSGRGSAKEFINLAADAVKRHRSALHAEDLAYLKSLPYTAKVGEAICVHGDLTDPKSFRYILDEEGAAANFASCDFKLLFAGHTHEPALFVTGRSGKVYKTAPRDFTLEAGKRYIINPGSVGYPREANGECFSSYVIYDTEERTVEFKFIPFKVSSVMQRGSGRFPWLKTAAVSAILLAAAVPFAWRFTRPAPPPPEEKPLAVKELRLEGSESATANLRLAKGSAPVNLEIVFLGKDGKRLSTETVTVKQSNSRLWKAPGGAEKAVFTLEKVDGAAEPKVELFSPLAGRRRGI